MGPVISAASRDHIVASVDKAVAAGGEPLVDGRGWTKRQPGTWVGPTVILKGKVSAAAAAAEESEEIFGPVLMVVKVCRRRARVGSDGDVSLFLFFAPSALVRVGGWFLLFVVLDVRPWSLICAGVCR